MLTSSSSNVHPSTVRSLSVLQPFSTYRGKLEIQRMETPLMVGNRMESKKPIRKLSGRNPQSTQLGRAERVILFNDGNDDTIDNNASDNVTSHWVVVEL